MKSTVIHLPGYRMELGPTSSTACVVLVTFVLAVTFFKLPSVVFCTALAVWFCPDIVFSVEVCSVEFSPAIASSVVPSMAVVG